MKDLKYKLPIALTVFAILIVAVLFAIMTNSIIERNNLAVENMKEKLQDMLEDYELDTKLKKRNNWIQDNIFIVYYSKNNTIEVITRAYSNCTVRFTIEQMPGVYVENDTMSVISTHEWYMLQDKPFDITQINSTRWMFNASVGDITQHVFQIINATQNQYVLYATKESIDEYYYPIMQKEYVININI